MSTYYAVCNVNGPISKAITADSDQEAIDQFRAADTQAWIDAPATDAEDDMDIAGEGMTEGQFAAAMERHGCKVVCDLSAIVCGQGATERVAHIADGWMLWRASNAVV